MRNRLGVQLGGGCGTCWHPGFWHAGHCVGPPDDQVLCCGRWRNFHLGTPDGQLTASLQIVTLTPKRPRSRAWISASQELWASKIGSVSGIAVVHNGVIENYAALKEQLPP